VSKIELQMGIMCDCVQKALGVKYLWENSRFEASEKSNHRGAHFSVLTTLETESLVVCEARSKVI
jgi:hypothetical protein